MSDDSRQRFRVLAAGVLSLVLCMGIARFAYTPLLPLMQAQAGLGAAGGGWLAAWNYLGYLSGALLAANISNLVLKDRLYRIGMVLAVLSTAAMAASTSPVWWCAWRFVAGLSSAAGMLLGTGLILNWLIRHDHRPELGIHFAGIGLGIALCAAAVAIMSRWFDWQDQWLLFALAAAALLVPALAWLPRPEVTAQTRSGQPMVDAPPSPLFMRVFMAAYFCAGVGYVVSATFIVAIVDALPGLAGRGALVFLVIGVAATPACIVWDLIARRIGMLNALLATGWLQIGGILLPLAGGICAALAGAVLFGITFIGLVSLVLTLAGRYYPTRPAKMMGKMTLSYGVAQIVAPAITGWIAETSGSYAGGLLLAAAAMLVGSLLLLALKLVERRDLNRAVTA
ncbi:MAG: YbfB/YjiJ family MFS transporter [Zoogloeaceae bacterium]|nr:YbfB/YjiJ family MFS transporter [Rhodocyclaceae bacterium]MCP5234828.1 YbfB/YjiJ family MFS transporter [Zoogloeaceae bacterium]